jgi:hypothetical protein
MTFASKSRERMLCAKRESRRHSACARRPGDMTSSFTDRFAAEGESSEQVEYTKMGLGVAPNR